MSATAAVFLLAIILFALGAALLPARSATVLAKVPRARGAAIALTCLCMAWATWTLYVHPIDFLSFLTPTTLIVGGLILTPLICIYLDNLLFARALGVPKIVPQIGALRRERNHNRISFPKSCEF